MNTPPPHAAYLDELRAYSSRLHAETSVLLASLSDARITGLDRIRAAASAAGNAATCDIIDRALDRLENGQPPNRSPVFRAGDTAPLGWAVYGPDGEAVRGYSRESGDGFTLVPGYNPPSLNHDCSEVVLVGYPAAGCCSADATDYLRAATPGTTLVEFHLLESPVDPVMWHAARFSSPREVELACGFAPCLDVARIIAEFHIKKNSFENPVP